MRRGAVDYAQKPLLGEDLLETVRQALVHATRNSDGLLHGHATQRGVAAIVGLVGARQDVPTIGQWARVVGLSSASLRAACRLAGLPARESLLLARMVRAVHESRHAEWDAAERLAVMDPRTLDRMLTAARLPRRAAGVTLDHLLQHQTFIDGAAAISALRNALRQF
jgi:hypothetical protein